MCQLLRVMTGVHLGQGWALAHSSAEMLASLCVFGANALLKTRRSQLTRRACNARATTVVVTHSGPLRFGECTWRCPVMAPGLFVWQVAQARAITHDTCTAGWQLSDFTLLLSTRPPTSQGLARSQQRRQRRPRACTREASFTSALAQRMQQLTDHFQEHRARRVQLEHVSPPRALPRAL